MFIIYKKTNLLRIFLLLCRSVFGSHDGSLVRRIKDDEGVEDDKVVSNKLVEHSTKTFVRTGATDVLVDEVQSLGTEKFVANIYFRVNVKIVRKNIFFLCFSA